MTEKCLGNVEHAMKLIVGAVQHISFQEYDRPPFNNLMCPDYDEPDGSFHDKPLTLPELREALLRNSLNSYGFRKDLCDRCRAAGI